MYVNLITGVIGVTLVGIFLLYYVVAVRSAPLSLIMIAILILVARALYDEAARRRDHARENRPRPPGA